MSEQAPSTAGSTTRENVATDRAEHAPADPIETVTFTLDGREVTGRKGEMLIAAAERAGTFIPRFCYHPRMKSVGVCRMCLVEVSGPRGASLQPSCYVEVQPGSEVVTDSDKVKKAQDGVLEFLLINHPLDCPVCDKGGECPLQDQTLAYGPGESRFVEEKRHFEKPIPISELVLLDRERCIQCSRCTRFADEVAGEAQIDFIGRGELLEVNTFPELPFSSYFSGNTVQICPVGALTATPYRFAARPWDLDQVESTCTTCAVGCRVAVQSSSNRVTRLLGIDADPVNHGWLCDKGRFAFDAVNSEERLIEPLIRKDGSLVAASWHEALAAVAGALSKATGEGGAESVAVLGGARLTNEGAYAWAKLAKGVLGTDSVDAQMGDGLPAELIVSLPRATIDQAAAADTVIVLAGDLREELPVLFLRLRSGVVDGNLSVVELAPRATSLTPYAATSLRYAPGEATDLVRALVDASAPGPATVGGDELAEGRRLAGAGNVVVIVGRPSLAEDGALVGEAAEALAAALPGARFLSGLRRGNVQGALDMGLAPGLLPGRVSLDGGRAWFTQAWGAVPSARGRDAEDILLAAAGDQSHGPRVSSLIVLGADPLGDFPDRRLAQRALDGAEFVVAVASTPSPLTEAADVVLPAAEAHERPGTTTNIEGRVSRLGQKLVPPGQAWPDWMIAAELAVHLDADLGLDSVGAVWDEIERLAPAYRGITRAVLDSPGATDGVLAPLPASRVSVGRRAAPAPLDPIAFPGVESVERQGAPPRAGLAEPPTAGTGSVNGDHTEGADGPVRPEPLSGPVEVDVPHVAPVDSYSMRLVASRTLYDLGAAVSEVPTLAGLVASAPLRANPHDLDDLGVASGGLVRVRTATASMVVPAVPDSSLPRKVVAADFNVPLGEGTIADLIDTGAPVVEVRMETPCSALATALRPLLAIGDPLYNHGVDWVVFLIVLIKVLVVFGALMVSVMLMIWFERKVISDMQSRIGPNRAGPFGIAQTLADGIKLFFKEDLLPDQADRFVFKLAPYLTIIPAFLAFAIVPIGGEVTIAGHSFEIQLADPPMGILFLLAMSSIGVYGIMLAGWSSGSKYPLLGSVRASAQMISYEAALGMTVVTVVLITGSLSTRTIVDDQAGHLWQWNVIRLAVVPFLIFFVAIVAETNRPPFDLVEADSELVGGFVTEYSSIRFALFFLAEFMNTITMSAITVTLFFGGPDGPIPHIPHLYWLWPILWFLGKTIVFLFVFVWLRAALPRLRYDQLMDLGWKRLIPLSLGWLLIVAGFVINGWWGVGMAAAVIVAAVTITRAFAVGAEREETRAILPPVGIRLWRRPAEPSAAPGPAVSPSTQGGDH